jgi:hypothetical protein
LNSLIAPPVPGSRTFLYGYGIPSTLPKTPFAAGQTPDFDLVRDSLNEPVSAKR